MIGLPCSAAKAAQRPAAMGEALAAIFKIARALDCSTAVLMAETESQIAASET